MAIIVNTNRQLLNKNKKPGEPAGRRRDVAIVANNGTRSYADLIGSLEGCSANVRFDERRDDFNVMQSTRIRMKLSGNTVALEVDARNVGRWRRCATIAHPDMRRDWAQERRVGIIPQASDKTNNHNLLGLRVYTDPNEAWADEQPHSGGDEEMDSLMHHMARRSSVGYCCSRISLQTLQVYPRDMVIGQRLGIEVYLTRRA